MTPTERLVAIARAELGYKEKGSVYGLDDPTSNIGAANYTKYARDLDLQGVFSTPTQGLPWDVAFVVWCCVTAFGVTAGTQMLGLKPTGNEYSHGALLQDSSVLLSEPQVGDLIFFSLGEAIDRVGIVSRVVAEDSKTTVYSIDGDNYHHWQSPGTIGIVSKTGFQLPHSGIAGYLRPDWSLVAEWDGLMTAPADGAETNDIINTAETEMNSMEIPAEYAAASARYNTVAEIEEAHPWAADTIRKLILKGFLRGLDTGVRDEMNYPADLYLTLDMIRVLYTNDRAGLYGD